MDKTTDERPAIGTPEAALEACVTLISAVTSQPEKLMGYYLDLYYQVRRQAEAAAERERILKCWDVGAPMPMTPDNGPSREPAPTEAGGTETPSTAEAPSAAAAAAPSERAPKARTDESKKKKVDFEEVLASASAGAPMPSKPKSAPWGNVKREIRERFLELRSKGMTIAQTVNLSGKKLTDGDVMNIMNAGKAEMKVYTALAEAMDKWEQVAGQQTKEDP